MSQNILQQEPLSTYLQGLQLTPYQISRIEHIFRIYTELFGIRVTDMFVSGYVTSDNRNVYENVWFFNSDYCFEAKNFTDEVIEDLDMVMIKNSIANLNFKTKNFNMLSNNYENNSSLWLEFFNTHGQRGEMKASKGNCLKLKQLIKDYFYTNLITPQNTRLSQIMPQQEPQAVA